MAQVICQVIHKPGRMSILWSAGPAAFEPIHLEGDALASFDQVARRTRQVLADAILGDQAAASELPQIGRDLHSRFFASGVGPEVAGWLRSLDSVESLEIGTDTPGRVPFGLFEDPEFPGAWGRRFPLAVGHRVSPLRSFAQIDSPKVLVAVDDDARRQLDDANRAALDHFLAEHNARLATSRLQLEETLDENVPDVIWILARLEGGAWIIGGERIKPQELADVIRHADDGNAFPIIVSTGIGAADEIASWECFLGAATDSLPGLVSLETPSRASPACDIGLSLLRAFLMNKLPIARALQQVRLDRGPIGLSLSAFTPARVRVLRDDDIADVGPPSRPLPKEPYHPLRPLEREDRALLFGRDDDIQACALLLDRPNGAGLFVHGRAGVGKASFVRAGLLPFLEEENHGFVVLRDRTEVGGNDNESEQPTLALRAGPDLAGSLVLGFTAFAARPIVYATPTGRSVAVDLPAVLHGFAFPSAAGAATGIQPLPSESATSATPAAIRPPAVKPGDVWDRIEQSPKAFADLVDRLTRDLPFELLIPVEHLDDLATLSEAQSRVPLAVDVLEAIAKSPARCRLIATLRTEFFGKVQSLLGDDLARASWQDHYLDPLGDERIMEILLAPAVTEPLAYTRDTPAATYRFDFEPGVATSLFDHIKNQVKLSGYAPLQVVHAAGSQLFEFCATRQLPAARAADVKRIAKVGAVAGFIDAKINRLSLNSRDKKAVRGLIGRFPTECDGIATRGLIAVDDLKQTWKTVVPTQTALNAAVDGGPLFEAQSLLVDGEETAYVTLSQDSLTAYASSQKREQAKRSFAWSKTVDALFVLIPLAILGMALTFFLTRRFTTWGIPQDVVEQNIRAALRTGGLANRPTLYAGMMAQADAALKQGNTLRARQLLLNQQPIPGALDVRGFEWFHLWKQINGEDAALVGHKAAARILAMSPDGKILASGDESGGVFLWNLDDLKEPLFARLTGLSGPVLALAVAPDGSAVAAADGPNVVVWGCPKPGKMVVDVGAPTTLEGAGKGILCLAFVGGSGTLAAGDRDMSVTLFDVAQKKAKWSKREHTAPINAIVAFNGGTTIASASDQQVIVWTPDGVASQTSPLPAGTRVSGLAVLSDKDGRLLAAGTSSKGYGSATGFLDVYDVKAKAFRPLGQRDPLAPPPLVPSRAANEPSGQRAAVSALAVVPDGKLAVTAGEGQAIYVDRASDSASTPFKLLSHVTAIRSLAAGGSRLASVGFDNAIKIWDTTRAFPAESVAGHDHVTALAFDPRERILASAGNDGAIKFWDPATGNSLGEIKSTGEPVTALAFSPKDAPLLLAAGVGKDARVWEVTLDKDVVAAKPILTLKKHSDLITCLSFGADAKSLAAGGLDRAVHVWLIPDGTFAGTIPSQAAVTALYFDGDLAIVGAADGFATFWDTEGRRIAPPYQAHGSAINALAIIRQRKVRGIASVSADQSFRTWAATNKEMSKFVTLDSIRGHHRAVTSLAQGKGFFATGGLDGTVKFWDYSLTDERYTYAPASGRPVRALALAVGRAILAVGDDAGVISFIRSEPRPSYGAADQMPEGEGNRGADE